MTERGRLLYADNRSWKLYFNRYFGDFDFRSEKLPELGRAAGNTLREFKNATKGLADDDNDKKKEDQ